MILLMMMIIPTLVALGFFLFGGKKITLGEFLAQNAIQAVVMSCFLGFAGCQNTHDTEIWSGRVTDKQKVKVSCRHSYRCNCVNICSSDSKGNQSCHEVCQTCYDHSYDIDWNVESTLGTFRINTIDRQGLKEPPRWTGTKINEPVSETRSFVNYIKASPDSLFRQQGLLEKYQNQIPTYPGETYDYWHIDRLVTVGVTVNDPALWNRDLHELNADVGPTKKAHVAVVLVKNQPHEYFHALEQAWIGAKKNDFIVVISVNDNNEIQWSEVMAWSQNKMAEVVVRDSIAKIRVLDRMAILQAIYTGVMKHFVKKKMEDFEYLKNSVGLTMGQWIFAMLTGLTISIGFGIFFLNNDHDQDNESWFFMRR